MLVGEVAVAALAMQRPEGVINKDRINADYIRFALPKGGVQALIP
jgi:hypothetical protein